MRFDPRSMANVPTPAQLRARRDEKIRRDERIVKLAASLAQRRLEGLSLYIPMDSVRDFHESRARWRVIDGSNQSGKTFAAAVEFARAMCGADPHGKYKKTGGYALMVGLDGDHLADPMLAKLIRPGAFSIIRDEKTRLWRSVRPDPENPTQLDPYDEAYREQWKESPPLIPPRMIRSIAYEDKKKGVPRILETTVGWTSLCRSSKGDPPQGRQFDLGWLDEQLSNDLFFKEMSRGFTRFGGVGMWSATPQITNHQLLDLRVRAEDGGDDVFVRKLLMSENPFFTEEAKQGFYNDLTPEEREVRWHGNYAIAGRRVYDYRPMGVHGCEPFQIPPTWTKYVILDPGTAHCGTLFVAVDPEEKHVWVYDGFDLPRGHARKWAAAIKEREKAPYEAFVIDQQAGKQTPMAAVDTVAQQYFAALKELEVKPRRKGPLAGFFPGSNDVRAREEALQGWLTVRPEGFGEGTAKLKVFRGFKKLDQQITRAHRNENGKRNKTYDEDLLVCLEYAAGFRPGYVRPETERSTLNDPILRYIAKEDKRSAAKTLVL